MPSQISTTFTCDFCSEVVVVLQKYDIGRTGWGGNPYKTVWPKGWFMVTKMDGKGEDGEHLVSCPECGPRKYLVASGHMKETE